MIVVMEKFQGWTPEKSKLYDEAFQKAFEMTEQEYLRAQKETSLREQAKAIAAEQFKNRAISEQVYRGALRGHLVKA